ncbi:hypothetical protein LXA43DRAFT_1100184 [Ganoderma leucocontextum]|nr:hypothetical protein LXA43DRAFT_1100184 [Ganoderma leucocontextum]
MPFSTVFSCDDVQFTTTPRLGLTGGHDNWQSVKISVQEMGLSNRWIYVESKGSPPPAPPVLHMALSEGWDLTCDECAMTLVLQGEDADTRAMVTQKLRFDKATDFWAFIFQVSLSCVREYTDRRAGPFVGESSA